MAKIKAATEYSDVMKKKQADDREQTRAEAVHEAYSSKKWDTDKATMEGAQKGLIKRQQEKMSMTASDEYMKQKYHSAEAAKAGRQAKTAKKYK